MSTAAVLLVDDVSVGRQFVAADPEHRAQRSRQRQEEAAVAETRLVDLAIVESGP